MLAAGTRVGPYEIVSWLGAGGMGEVYRARDTKLHREVALKTLPEELAHQPDRLARLKHEARILASLNHPGIATLHGLEESNGGVPVLVMELVEGETLAHRLRLGPLPVREALKVAHEIAVALEAAHEKGVLHRDLKPENIRFGPGGRVKVLDFGLAKAVRKADVDSNVATATSPSRVGTIAGTAAYMSPEQARGHDLDRRSDVWAFGCVLYEILSGKRAFGGATFSDTLAAVLDREPDWEAMPPGTPPAVLRLLRRCLQKEKDKRLRDIGDARLDLEELQAAPPPSPYSEAASLTGLGARGRVSLGKRLVWLLGAAAAGAGLWALLTSKPSAERPIVQLAISPPSGTVVVGWSAPAVAISPDGTQLAYVATSRSRAQLFVRSLDRLESRAIQGTEGARMPFFSPDGRWLGFFSESEGKLKKVLLGGGMPLTVCDVSQLRGATWSPEGTIVFVDTASSELFRVSADGGTPEPLTTLDAARHEASHRLPEFLPDGQNVVFTAKSDDTATFDDARIEAVSLRTRERSVLIEGGTNPRYAAGHLFYERGGSLWAAPLDPKGLRVTGPSVQVLDGVSSSPQYGSADFAVSRDGSLVYVPGKPIGTDRRLVRVSRTGGAARPLTSALKGFNTLRLSPDGRRLALVVEGANDQVWTYDLERSTLTPQTLRFNNVDAIWTRDGSRLTIASDREGSFANIYWQPADGSGSAERLTRSPRHWQSPQDWTPDGKSLLFVEWGPRADLWILPLEGDRTPRPILQGSSKQWQGRLSPNGRWLAYVSDESGGDEVYVRPFPSLEGRTLVSTDGGALPVWARNGAELFYMQGDRMMAVTVTNDATFRATKPRLVFEAKILPYPDSFSYDVTPDGDFLMVERGESDTPPTQINVIVNWLQEVRQRVAARR
jgi:eukaryotic-like serine/threonine-protein kinase